MNTRTAFRSFPQCWFHARLLRHKRFRNQHGHERGGKKKLASVSTIMTGNVAHSRPENAAGDNEVISSLLALYKTSKVKYFY